MHAKYIQINNFFSDIIYRCHRRITKTNRCIHRKILIHILLCTGKRLNTLNPIRKIYPVYLIIFACLKSI